MSFLKGVGKFFAGLFILLGITIFIMSSFGGYAVDNIHILEDDVSSEMNRVLQESGIDCNQNPDNENCQILNENPVLDRVEKEVSEFGAYGGMMKIFGIVFFIIGVFLFVWCSGWINGLRQTSLVSFIGIIFSYLYYNYAITGAVNSFLPQEMVGMIGNWINVTLNQTLNVIFILGVTFLILTVGLYILHRAFKKSSIKKDISKK